MAFVMHECIPVRQQGGRVATTGMVVLMVGSVGASQLCTEVEVTFMHTSGVDL